MTFFAMGAYRDLPSFRGLKRVFIDILEVRRDKLESFLLAPSMELVASNGHKTSASKIVNMLRLGPQVQFPLVIEAAAGPPWHGPKFCFSVTLNEGGELKLTKMDDFDKRALMW